METIVASIPHGVVFLYDPSMIIDAPSDTGSASLLSTPNCLSIWTISEDEGQVELTLDQAGDHPAGSPAFDGILETEGRKLAFNDSSCNPLIVLEVAGVLTRVRVYTNDARYPTKVRCVVGG